MEENISLEEANKIIKKLNIEFEKSKKEHKLLIDFIENFRNLSLKEKRLFIEDKSRNRYIFEKIDQKMISVNNSICDNYVEYMFPKTTLKEAVQSIEIMKQRIKLLSIKNNNIRSFIEKFYLLPLKEKISFLNTASSRSKSFTDIDNEFSITNGNQYINQNQKIKTNDSSRHR